MKLLLDEMHSPSVASALVKAGYDVLAAVDDQVLRSTSDPELLAYATAEGRAVVTENIRDFRRIAGEWARSGRTHVGIVYTSRTRFPRSSTTYPRDLIRALKRFLETPPNHTRSPGWEWWLDT